MEVKLNKQAQENLQADRFGSLGKRYMTFEKCNVKTNAQDLTPLFRGVCVGLRRAVQRK